VSLEHGTFTVPLIICHSYYLRSFAHSGAIDTVVREPQRGRKLRAR
jgi:hypothetical protein